MQKFISFNFYFLKMGKNKIKNIRKIYVGICKRYE